MQVIGMITRKDVAEANAKLALGRKANLGLTTPSERLVRASTLPFIPYGAYDPTVGSSNLYPLAEGEEDGHATDSRRFTLEDAPTPPSNGNLGWDSGRRRPRRGQAAGEDAESPGSSEHRSLLDDAHHLV